MSDETEEGGTPRSTGSSAGSAARRARRIGGRPAGRPSPSPAGTGSAARHAARQDAAAGAPPATPASTPPTSKPAADTPTVEISKPAKPAKVKAAKTKAAKDDGDDAPVVVVTQVPRWLLWLPATVLVVVAIVFAIAVGVTAHGVWYAKASTNSVRDEVLAAAKTCVAATNSYKYTTIAADERNGLQCTTGTWTTNYRKAMEQILIPSSKTLKSTQVAQINAAGVVSVQSHGSVWKLLVFGQVSVTSINQKTARPDPFSAVVTMQKSGGKWKVADIDQVLKPIKTSS